jgi:hypothetical protein
MSADAPVRARGCSPLPGGVPSSSLPSGSLPSGSLSSDSLPSDSLPWSVLGERTRLGLHIRRRAVAAGGSVRMYGYVLAAVLPPP